MNVVQGTLVPHSFWRKWMKNILCVDMDNTIIYSYKHDIGEKKLNVELMDGKSHLFLKEPTRC